MASLNDPDVRIQVMIRKDTPHGQFCDALYFGQAEFDALRAEEVEALKDARVSGWLSALTAKSEPQPEPTEDELVAQKVALEEQAVAIEAQVAEVSAKLSVAVAKRAMKADPVAEEVLSK